MKHLVPLTNEQWAKLEPLIPQPESAATLGRPPIDECLVLGEMKDLASRVALFIFYGSYASGVGTRCVIIIHLIYRKRHRI
jgi:transposase